MTGLTMTTRLVTSPNAPSGRFSIGSGPPQAPQTKATASEEKQLRRTFMQSPPFERRMMERSGAARRQLQQASFPEKRSESHALSQGSRAPPQSDLRELD